MRQGLLVSLIIGESLVLISSVGLLVSRMIAKKKLLIMSVGLVVLLMIGDPFRDGLPISFLLDWSSFFFMIVFLPINVGLAVLFIIVSLLIVVLAVPFVNAGLTVSSFLWDL